ncbi:MAG TPA: prepilin-type N-terminal cleavage/methylation domain-containing protein [Pyrinomonadaceae bacterium]|nr:prepilin-type N-terminal cleavage/methylation domain-containing protein [Pyrinomonadaceae bacterium]
MSRSSRAIARRARRGPSEGERGFTLIETTIALLIMMIVMLGVASLFAFSVFNNTSGSDRAQTLAVAQQTMETLRSARFSNTGTDAVLNAGTVTQNVTRGASGAGQRPYTVVSTIVDTTPTIKTITVSVTPTGAGPSWATGSAASVTIVTQRAKTDQ